MNDAGEFERTVPVGDNRPRLVCQNCGFINYENPKVVVGSVCVWETKILLCRRAIEPRKGFWTIPAGYLEVKETTAAGAAREAMEEANADIAIRSLLAVYNIARLSQVQIIYLADLRSAEVSAGAETLELGLYAWDQIPFGELAFPSVRWALHQYRSIKDQTVFAPFTNPEGETGDLRPRRD